MIETKNGIDIDTILPLVSGPSQYIGCEWNVIKKPWSEARLTICLAVPDFYERSIRRFDLQRLYHDIHRRPGLLAERLFFPGSDLWAELETQGFEPFSLENKKFLSEFDVIVVLVWPGCEEKLQKLLQNLDPSSRPLIVGNLVSDAFFQEDFFFSSVPVDVWVLESSPIMWDAVWDTLTQAKEKSLDRKDVFVRLSGHKGLFVPSYDQKEKLTLLSGRTQVQELPLPLAPLVPVAGRSKNVLEISWKGEAFCSCFLCQREPLASLSTPEKILRHLSLQTGVEEIRFHQDRTFGSAVYSLPAEQTEAIQRLRFCFAREGLARYYSQLEQIQLIRQVFRRSGLPVAMSQGKQPQPRLAFGPAISVGYESTCEYVDVDFTRRCDPARVEKTVQSLLPEGFSLRHLKRIPLLFPSLEQILTVVSYEVQGPQVLPADVLEQVLSQKDLTLEKQKNGRRQTIVVQPLLVSWSIQGSGIRLTLKFGPGRHIKPERLLQQIFHWSDRQTRLLRVRRDGLFWQDKNGQLHEP